MEEELVRISKSDLIDLLISREELRLLEFGGVSKWDWYGESLSGDSTIGLKNLDEISDDISEQIDNMEEMSIFSC